MAGINLYWDEYYNGETKSLRNTVSKSSQESNTWNAWCTKKKKKKKEVHETSHESKKKKCLKKVLEVTRTQVLLKAKNTRKSHIQFPTTLTDEVPKETSENEDCSFSWTNPQRPEASIYSTARLAFFHFEDHSDSTPIITVWSTYTQEDKRNTRWRN